MTETTSKYIWKLNLGGHECSYGNHDGVCLWAERDGNSVVEKMTSCAITGTGIHIERVKWQYMSWWTN